MNHNETVPSFKYLVQASNRSSIQHICIYEKKLRTNSCDAMYQKEHPASSSLLCYGLEPLDPTETTICGSRHFCLKQISSDLLLNQTATSRQNENHLGLKQSAARHRGKTGFWQVWPHTVLLRDIDERALTMLTLNCAWTALRSPKAAPFFQRWPHMMDLQTIILIWLTENNAFLCL